MSSNVNKSTVKSITNRFEVLSEKSKENGVFIKKNVVVCNNAIKRDDFKSNKDRFGPSCKRLKDSENFNVFKIAAESSKFAKNDFKTDNDSGMLCQYKKRLKDVGNRDVNQIVAQRVVSPSVLEASIEFRDKHFNIKEPALDCAKPRLSSQSCEESGENIVKTRSLSRQFSDPVKRLHRSPAFRCDKSEKLRDSRKNSINSDCSDSHITEEERKVRDEQLKNNTHLSEDAKNNAIAEPDDRSKLSKDKLKKLGYLLEERMRQDSFEFSKPKKQSQNGQGAPQQVPQHILDQYAKVNKPKSKQIVKTDPLFSDSGVSSESENLISDDLEECVNANVKSFGSIRKNFEANAKESDDSRRTFLKRCVNGDEIRKTNNDAVSYQKNIGNLTLTDTLKKVLKEPLPQGPPPKKPPRTFAVTSPEKSPEIIKKNFKNKHKNVRSKEESKHMLAMIENALIKHETSGKIMSPRPVKKIESKPKDVHYMCTEILDIHLEGNESVLSSNDASLNSSLGQNSMATIRKCLNNLNCANSLRGSSDISYTKFGTSPSNVACCSCDFRGLKPCDSTEELQTSNARLSTFLPLKESSNNSVKSCHSCGSVGSNKAASKSTFFVDRTKSQYGALKKSKSQEHIYAEPLEIKSQCKTLAKPNFVRSGTLIDDDFRSKDFTKIITNAPQISVDIFGKQKRLSSNSYFDCDGHDAPSSGSSNNTLTSFKSEKPSKERSANDSATPPQQRSKVKDILKRLEGDRRSLRADRECAKIEAAGSNGVEDMKSLKTLDQQALVSRMYDECLKNDLKMNVAKSKAMIFERDEHMTVFTDLCER